MVFPHNNYWQNYWKVKFLMVFIKENENKMGVGSPEKYSYTSFC